MNPNIEGLHIGFSDILKFLEDRGEVSWRTMADENFRKVLLIAVASHFERSLQDTVFSFVKEIIGDSHPLAYLIHNKAILRQYHTWFDWDSSNANRFFSLFGDAFKDSMQQMVRDDDSLNSSIQAFLEIGRERNRLVHRDFSDFTLEKTSEEIYSLYSDANRFIERFPDLLRDFIAV